MTYVFINFKIMFEIVQHQFISISDRELDIFVENQIIRCVLKV